MDTNRAARASARFRIADLSRRQVLQGGAILGAGAALAACGASPSKSPASVASGKPKRGGRLTVGVASGGPTDTLDPGKCVSGMDFYRSGALFDCLAYFDPQFNLKPQLAESMEPNSNATKWTIRLRQGVTWHDGKPLTADDVIYTLNRNKTIQLIGTFATSVIDFTGLKKLDSRTLEIPLVTPQADFDQDMTYPLAIVQDGATDFTHPIGTGAFEFVSWTPGQTSLFKRYPDYYLSGQPYVDSLVFTSISDATARVNALLDGQVNAIDQISFAAARQYKNSTSFKVEQSPPGSFIPFTMACDTPPFNDVRVRQAMRLIADRPSLVETAVLGFGGVGNDLSGKGEVDYDTSLTQRVQDIDQAKSLLRAAGHENLSVVLNTSQLQVGMLEAGTAFAQQATAAGVKVTINNIPVANFYGPEYLKYPFGMTDWTASPVTAFMAGALAPGAPFNETHWHNTQFNSLYTQARATLSPSLRKELLFEAQKLLWDEGGYIIWGLVPYIDGIANAVHMPPATAAGDLGGGNLWSEFWID